MAPDHPPATDAAPRELAIQLLSDLHLETERYDPKPVPGADVLVLAGDIDATWHGYARFADWPVPVLAVAGNHEFDGREWLSAWPALRAWGEQLGIRWLEHEACTLRTARGVTVRWLGATRWSDYGVFGEEGRARAERSGAYFQRLAQASLGGSAMDVAAVRALGLQSRAWLEQGLVPARTQGLAPEALGDPVDLTVAVTHFAPSLRCADPRFGVQAGTASFCNADDDLLPAVDLWLHGHLHCRHDFTVVHPPGAPRRSTRVVSHARGHVRKREAAGHDPSELIRVPIGSPKRPPRSRTTRT
jgi:Calcineurin-like phosphoesterase